MYPFRKTEQTPIPQFRDSATEQCSPRSTSHSTAASVVCKVTEREMLLKKISTYQFAALDLQLFLDTHPGDSKMIEKMEEYRNAARPLIKEYEEKFGPLTKSTTSSNNWLWIKSPWPWESEEDN